MADQLGPLENYTLRDYHPGDPAPGQVRIAVRAVGVSFVDVLNATGQYQGKAPVPFIPGSEFSGVIDAVGEGVSQWSVGQPVIASSWGGAFADLANVDSRSVSPMPEGMSFECAAVFKVSALTAWHGLVDRGQLQVGEALLVLGAGGATGYAAVQIGRHLGARVIASASTEAKRQMALAGGADVAVDARGDDWREAVKAANGGKPVDVVFDPVGGDTTGLAFRCLGYGGRHLVVGFPGGISALPTNLPLLKSAALVGVNLQQQSLNDPARAAANSRKVFELAEQGLLTPVVAETYALEQFADAMTSVAGGKGAGRIVLKLA
ncbi:NADPH:quinone oxidoreductase family protein [Pseudomaricurvus sp. HS19]|uniref:NADPH:quinone oxidoreductase family protein n=1 Tax=Pseudomaricurvus sp. HS19 TaxID=2692626 RepID=UPI001926B984|nr:NADPH:quinone oxidoreductase family protein [Pseudomaricurvus sp. HS19]